MGAEAEEVLTDDHTKALFTFTELGQLMGVGRETARHICDEIGVEYVSYGSKRWVPLSEIVERKKALGKSLCLVLRHRGQSVKQ